MGCPAVTKPLLNNVPKVHKEGPGHLTPSDSLSTVLCVSVARAQKPRGMHGLATLWGPGINTHSTEKEGRLQWACDFLLLCVVNKTHRFSNVEATFPLLL